MLLKENETKLYFIKKQNQKKVKKRTNSALETITPEIHKIVVDEGFEISEYVW